MLNNVGKNIKFLSKVLFVIECIIAIFAAIVAETVLVFLIALPCSAIFCYLVYGFGELIEKVSQIARNTKNDDDDDFDEKLNKIFEEKDKDKETIIREMIEEKLKEKNGDNE